MRRFFASTSRSVLLIWSSSTLLRASAIFCSTISRCCRAVRSRSLLVSVWLLMLTIGTGDAGVGVDEVLFSGVACCVGDACVGDAGDCCCFCVPAGVLRLVGVLRRGVWAAASEEMAKKRSSEKPSSGRMCASGLAVNDANDLTRKCIERVIGTLPRLNHKRLMIRAQIQQWRCLSE